MLRQELELGTIAGGALYPEELTTVFGSDVCFIKLLVRYLASRYLCIVGNNSLLYFITYFLVAVVVWYRTPYVRRLRKCAGATTTVGRMSSRNINDALPTTPPPSLAD